MVRGRAAAAAFTLIEMLMVVLVVAILMGFLIAAPSMDEREAQVGAAADELAAVLRSARAMAMESRGMYAVSFNIQNPPGGSGLILSNRSGGHWYRIIGPRNENLGNYMALPGSGFPPLYSRSESSLNGAVCDVPASMDSPLRHQLEAVEKAWVGDRRQLPAGKVRFVALTDQDNGNYRDNCTNWEWGALKQNGDTYPPTYPRPWFGWWDAASGRLYPWGGYDPALAMTAQTGPNAWLNPPRSLGGRTISHSGFFYEGYDGAITGCVQPSDRLLFDDLDNNGTISSAAEKAAATWPLWRAGEPRPLINGRWQDFMIVFRPDGTAFADWMRLRRAVAANATSSGNLFYDPSLSGGAVVLPAAMPAGKCHMMQLGPGDMCNRDLVSGTNPVSYLTESTSFASRSGFSFITLGPDADPDNDRFPSALAALRTLQPLYRVGVSAFGEVIVVRVSPSKPAGKDYDTVLGGTDWNVTAKTNVNYRDGMLVDPISNSYLFKPRGSPITDVVTPEMLSGRLWWWR